MAQNEQLVERYSPAILKKLRKESVFLALTNRRYEGNPTAGAVQIPVRDGEVAVNEYSITDGATLTHSTTSYKTLVTDSAYAVNELIDGYVASGVPDDLKADRLDSAGYSMAKHYDDAIITLLTTSGKYTASATATATALSSDTIYSVVVKDIQKAKKLGVSVGEMWLAVTNETYEIFLNSPKFVPATMSGDNVISKGIIGYIAGVKVVETNNIPDAKKVDYILGNNQFVHFVQDWKVEPTINDIKDAKHIGASALQGRTQYGLDVSRPTTIFVKLHS